MGRTLVIAEKPSVARDIVAALGGHFVRHAAYHESEAWIVSYAVGHLVGLAEPEEYDPALKRWRAEDLPIMPDVFRLKPVDEKARAQLAALYKLLQRPDVDRVVNACDAGREGELIFAYIYELCRASKPVERLWISSMTAQAISDGFASVRPGAQMADLESAARSRSEADWLVGMNATRAATLRARGYIDGVVSLGRVQTPTLALIVKRDLEIAAFGSATYQIVRADFATQTPEPYGGLWISTTGETRIDDKAAAERIAAKVAGRPGRVVSVECKQAREKSPLLYDLTSLQRDANKRFGFSAERTLKAAQALYEQRKALTYPRTDSRYLTSDMKPQLKKVARTLERFSEYAQAVAFVVGLAKIPPRIVDDKNVSDHHAIIPTSVRHDASGWSDDERKVFDLVARRFLAVFHPDALYEKTTVISEVESERFRTRGKVILNAGWRAVYDAVPDDADDKKADDEDEGALLPALAQGAPVDCTGAAAEEKKTKPPAHFNENLLLAAMETAGKLVDDDELREAMKDGGLGTPATRAAIIETLIRRGYVKRKGKRLLATEKGIQTIELLGGHPLTSAELTGLWEKKLSEVACGKLDRDTFMAMIRRFTADDVAATIATLSSPTLGAPPVDDLCPCPRCGATIRETPRAFSCSSWKSKDEPGCGFVVWKQIAKRRLTADEARELITEGHTGVLEGFISAKNKPFAAALALGQDGKTSFEFPRNRGGEHTSAGALGLAANGEESPPRPASNVSRRSTPTAPRPTTT
jgi:DNA topoisomerase-3